MAAASSVVARIQVAPSQAGPSRWEVFCDGHLMAPSLSREEAFDLAHRLEAGPICNPQPQPHD